MADKKISALTEKTVIELTDTMVLVDNTANPIQTKKCIVANFLISLGIASGYFDNKNLTKDVPFAVIFDAELGTATDGSDYNLIIKNTDGLETKEVIGYEITSRSETGFTIVSLADSFLEWTAIKK